MNWPPLRADGATSRRHRQSARFDRLLLGRQGAGTATAEWTRPPTAGSGGRGTGPRPAHPGRQGRSSGSVARARPVRPASRSASATPAAAAPARPDGSAGIGGGHRLAVVLAAPVAAPAQLGQVQPRVALHAGSMKSPRSRRCSNWLTSTSPAAPTSRFELLAFPVQFDFCGR